ncbi:MAG: hypothetical protein IAE92_02525 [Burkholderiaceae bacterium]|nr:hypothetical protein [Burkholderiaceae bacterium]
MNEFKRWRWWAVLALPLAVIVLNSFGPDGWREPATRLVWLSWSALAVALAWSASKALFDYAHGREAWVKAMEHPIGAGIAFAGLCVLRAVLFWGIVNFSARAADDPATYVPAPAHELASVARAEIDRTWPQMPRRSYLGALVEKETCITLRHRSCWSPAARLKTSREEGAGLGQITRAWHADGRLRFDALAEARALDPHALAELDWVSVYQRADLNFRAALVKLRQCDAQLRRLGNFADLTRVAFCDAAYNGGWAGLQQDRRLCQLTPGCDPAQWFGHVEHTSGKSRQRWQGYGQSAFEINRAHVAATVRERRLKYALLLGV